MVRPSDAIDISFAALGGAPLLRQADERLLVAYFMGVSRLFHEIAHDMRGPLHSMTLHLELLRLSLEEPGNPESKAKQERYLGSIGAEIQRLARMIEALWGHSGTPEHPVETFDLRDTVRALAEVLDPHCRRSQVRLRVRLPDMPIEVSGSPDAIRHAALDLVSHALSAMPDGGELEILLERREGHNLLRVAELDGTAGSGPAHAGSDRAAGTFPEPGMAEPINPHIARLVIEAHGGSLRVISNANRPPRFELTLPLPSSPTQPNSE